MQWGTVADTEDKPPGYVPRPELREILNSVTDIRELLPIAIQSKLGLRVGQLHNIQLRDVNLQQPELKRQYPSVGTHEQIRDRPNVVYIAQNDEPDGDKSAVPRILPLDDELKWAFARYLRIRPTWVETWFFLSKEDGSSTHKRSVEPGKIPSIRSTSNRMHIGSHPPLRTALLHQLLAQGTRPTTRTRPIYAWGPAWRTRPERVRDATLSPRLL